MKRRNFFGLSVGAVLGFFGVKFAKAKASIDFPLYGDAETVDELIKKTEQLSVDEAESFRKRWKDLEERVGFKGWYYNAVFNLPSPNKGCFGYKRVLCFNGEVAVWKIWLYHVFQFEHYKGVPLTIEENRFFLNFLEKIKVRETEEGGHFANENY